MNDREILNAIACNPGHTTIMLGRILQATPAELRRRLNLLESEGELTRRASGEADEVKLATWWPAPNAAITDDGSEYLEQEEPEEQEERLLSLVDEIKDRYDWRKVKAPRKWVPADVGDELVGYYGGRTQKDGQFGPYELVTVHVPLEGSYTLSGTQLIQLLDASMVVIGHPIRVVWCGLRETPAGHMMKTYEVLIADGETPLPEEALPNHGARH